MTKRERSFHPCFGKPLLLSDYITHHDSGGQAALGLMSEQAVFAQPPQVVLKKKRSRG